MKADIERDGEYYRVILRQGTHKLHSEKLNLETAADLYFHFRKGWEERVFDLSSNSVEQLTKSTGGQEIS